MTTVNDNGASSSQQQGTLTRTTRRSIVDLQDPATILSNVNVYQKKTFICGNVKHNETGSRSPCMRPRGDLPNFGPIECGEKQTNNIE